MKKKMTVFPYKDIHANKDLNHRPESIAVKDREGRVLKGIYTGAIVGGILSTLVGFLNAGPGLVGTVDAPLIRT